MLVAKLQSAQLQQGSLEAEQDPEKARAAEQEVAEIQAELEAQELDRLEARNEVCCNALIEFK